MVYVIFYQFFCDNYHILYIISLFFVFTVIYLIKNLRVNNYSILKTLKYTIISIFCLFIYQIGLSQSNFTEPDYIKSIVFKPSNTNTYAPIIKLGDKLLLSFDDLNANEQDYTYKIVHYTFDWKPSNLIESEYVKGYAEDRIRDYENSFNTLQNYTHYQLSIPNENTSLKISGNYLITVFDETETPVLKRRFVVYEPIVTVGVNLQRSAVIANIQEKQTVAFSINYPQLSIANPSQEIKPVLLQNHRWETAITGLKPQFYKHNQLLYKYPKATSFWGGNEFLYFDSKSIRSTTLNIANTKLGNTLYHTYLYPNQERAGQVYTLYPDVNGAFIIRNLLGNNSATDADYSWVHFSLKTNKNLEQENVYVSGRFNNWQLNNSNKLQYNTKTGLYETAILLKQGFYNYQYVTKTATHKINTHLISGTHYQTENDYTVLVYYTKFGSRYHRVIGVGFGNSQKSK